MQPWEKLREDLKESNRRQADQIPEKLAAVGYAVRPLGDAKPAIHGFSAEEVEILSRMEHDRWMAEKLKNGWKFGPQRDDNLKLHPSLVLWEDLPESEKDKDRQTVLRIPQYLGLAGLKMVKQ